MALKLRILVTTAVFLRSLAHQQHSFDDHEQNFFSQGGEQSGKTWLEKYGPQIDQTFSGPLSFSHLPYFRCLENEEAEFDIAILGLPFDTAVTYRPGYYLYFHPDNLTSVLIAFSLERALAHLRFARVAADSVIFEGTHFPGETTHIR
ncbi:hypothetical protein GALMADRAFT_378442 [Galerina marginata CBS 339.88]|uniref:Agmatinase n=1 Tax=Galerina marginata (strain CBS 339.88) TaxID=685588 RepID=A0A067TR23_GALM3|nr:hypothetical protein GALMADRAFT_378442 [Galerina marginata CBS 339.88]